MSTDHDQYQMQVNGMTCDHCEASVERALIGARAREARASVHRGEATFAAPADTAARLAADVRQAGYRPRPVRLLERPARPGANGGGDGRYDLAIVGSGSAAFAAAIKARGQGARVAMIERGTLGGTCVNIGCIPSKTLLRGAEVYHAARRHPFEGVETHAGTVDYGALVAQKDDLVAHLRREKYANLIGEYDWELVQGEACFADEATLVVGDRFIRASAYLIATGARPAVPPIPGLAEAGYLTSTAALALPAHPRSLVILGAGYVALELGQLFHRLGAKVTLLQRGTRLMRDYEPEIAEAVGAMLTQEGIEVITGAQVRRVERVGAIRRVHVEVAGEPRVLEGEQVLVATGRTPNVEALDLTAAGVAVDERGAIVVDEALRTSNPRVWAAGDVTLWPQYVYVAAYQGGLAAENALTAAGKLADLSALPGVVFTDPQVATVGLTEVQAQAQGYDVKTAVLPISAAPRAQVNYEDTSVFKLVADAATDQLLGVHVVAGNAGDVIYAATLAVKHRLTVADLVESFAPYLTMAEGLKLGALAFDRDVAKLSCCAA